MKFEKEKMTFLNELRKFTILLDNIIAETETKEWTIKGFIDIFKNIYSISADTKVISKILELHLFPHFLNFADKINYRIELAQHQNYYPDLTFISKVNPKIKFAVDLKTTYRNKNHPDFCNGFTLGSHGEYFINRESRKNIQYPYAEYSGHFCLGIIYSRTIANSNLELKNYVLDELNSIPSVIKDFIFFAEEKWKIASDKGGSGNTANIGSIQKISDILEGKGTFCKAGEKYFDDYWINYGKIDIIQKNGKTKKLSSFKEYLEYRGLEKDLYVKPVSKRGDNKIE